MDCLPIVVHLILLSVAIASGVEIPSWSYEDVSTWPSRWPECGRKYQDPVNIPFETTRSCFRSLHWLNLDWPQRGVLFTNTYRTLHIELDRSYPILFAGGPLASNKWYYGTQLSFSFGSNNSVGSDRTIRGRSFPVEVKLYASVDRDAVLTGFVNSPSVAVLSWMVEVSPRDNPAWTPLLSNLRNIQQGGTQTFGSLGPLRSLLPTHEEWQHSYFTYQGSLSTPPCKTDVTRIVYTTPIQLSSSQIEAFRQLNNEHGLPISNQNYKRPMSPRDNRVFYRSFY